MKEKLKTPEQEKAFLMKQLKKQSNLAKTAVSLLSDIRDTLHEIERNTTHSGYVRKLPRINAQDLFLYVTGLAVAATAATYVISTLF